MRKRLSGQASLEMTAAFIVVFILFIVAVRIFAWVNASLMHRQLNYENSRVSAGKSVPTGVTLLDPASTKGVEDESSPSKLNIFE